MSNKEDDKSSRTNRDLIGIVQNEKNFSKLQTPGGFQISDLTSDKELFIIQMPREMINTSNLVNCSMIFGGNKERNLCINNKSYEVAAYPLLPSTTPALFLPDDTGKLHHVNVELSGQVVLRDHCGTNNKTTIDIDSMRAATHRPPDDIAVRHFYSPPTKGYVQSKLKESDYLTKVKKKKKKISIDKKLDKIEPPSSPNADSITTEYEDKLEVCNLKKNKHIKDENKSNDFKESYNDIGNVSKEENVGSPAEHIKKKKKKKHDLSDITHNLDNNVEQMNESLTIKMEKSNKKLITKISNDSISSHKSLQEIKSSKSTKKRKLEETDCDDDKLSPLRKKRIKTEC